MIAEGGVGILNVGAGDTRLSFDKDNPAERIRAARIVTDMLRRGYALLVEVERRGKKSYQRVLKFREDKCEYIIADYDSSTPDDDQEEPHVTLDPPAAPKAGKRGRKERAIPAEKHRAVAVARSAGG